MNRGTKRQLSGTALRSYAAAVVLAFLSACATAPQTMHASADPKNGDGIGGTGIQSAAVNPGSGDGIGGTGIGNTGVRGTITGFGSILVNGLTLEFDHTTTVEIDGKPASLEALKIGQIVQGVAQTKSGKLNLATIEIQHAVTGPISAINHAQETLTVLGQKVRLNLGGDKNAIKAFTTLKAGDMINVSGLRQTDGTIIATRVDQKSDEDRSLVRGTVTAVSATTIRVGDFDVPRLPGDKTPAPKTGEHVTVSGRMINGAFTPEALVLTPPLAFDRDVAEVSLEAYAPKAATTPGPLSIDGINVTGAALPPGTEVNTRIVVTGRIDGPNSLVATGIESVRTVVTINTARGSQRPAAVRPDTTRPERVAPRPDIERPQAVRPETPGPSRPTIERPQGVPLV
jgi:predicted regulator of Ras-like GTPase activity (Roadblock/LC7/MglB family)